jgi:hypothetical protein
MPKRVPTAFVLCFASILCIELVLYSQREWLFQNFFLPCVVPFPEESIIDQQWKVSQNTSHHAEILIVGDSSGLMGIDAIEMESRLGHSTYNLSTIAFLGTQGHAALLEQYLLHHSPPRIVVYAYAPSMMGLTPKESREYGDRLDALIHRKRSWLPSLDYRMVARNAISGKLRFNALDLPRGSWPSHRELTQQMTQSHGSLQESAEPNWTQVPEIEATLSEWQSRGLRKLSAIAVDYQVRVCVVASPLPEIADSSANRRSLESLASQMRSAIGASEHVELILPLARFFPNEECSSIKHLHPTGIERNTIEVCRIVQQAQASEAVSRPTK